MNKLIIIIPLIFATLNTSNANSNETNLYDPVEIKAALQIHSSLMAIGRKISSCSDSGKKHSLCLCENRKEISNFNKTVNNALKKHSRWLNYKSVNFKKPNGVGVTIRPSALKKQASMEAKCD